VKATIVIAIAVSARMSGEAAQVGGNDRTVIVEIANEYVAMRAAAFAKAQATKMFAEIGVQIRWQGAGRERLPAHAILVDLVEEAPPNECAHALACAKPYEGTHIRVFYDRLRTRVRSNLVPPLLGHVLVHEIAHILEGTNRHSDRGVMKAEWDPNDFEEMRYHTLPFTATDVSLIKLGLATRESRDFPRALPKKAPDQ
jgi:hypothetical protein